MAFADMTVTPSELRIHTWEIVDLIQDESVNVNESSTEVLIQKSAQALQRIVSEWTVDKPDVAFLESQPLGQMARNVKTKTLSHVLQAMLIAKDVTVEFVSPKLKLKGMPAGSYGDNKKFAVASTLKLLEACGLLAEKEEFETKKGKRDDLADALLQGYYAAKLLLSKTAKSTKPKAKRAKRDAHATTQNAIVGELL